MAKFGKALLIVNPTSGLGRGERIGERVRRGLDEHGTSCTVRVTSGPGEATEWAFQAGAEGFDVIVAVGGDGTLQEVVAGQARADNKVPVSLVPTGTANVVAIALSLPWLPGPAVETIVAGRVRSFDIGYVPELDRHFILMAAIGYPARIIQDSPRHLKKNLGVLAYLWAGLRNLFKPGHARLTIHADGQKLSFVGHTILVTNIGAIEDIHLRVAPETSAHDGRFDLSIISNRTIWGLLPILARMLTWRRPATRRYRHMQAAKLQVEAVPPLPIQIDGEAIGKTPFTTEVKPRAVHMVVGARYDRRSGPTEE